MPWESQNLFQKMKKQHVLEQIPDFFLVFLSFSLENNFPEKEGQQQINYINPDRFDQRSLLIGDADYPPLGG